MQQIERHEHQLAFVRVAGAHLGHQPAAKEQAAREAAEERARVAALPSTRLMNGYSFFAHVQWCRDVARHVYIRNVEFQRAQTAIKAFEKQTKKEDATMNEPFGKMRCNPSKAISHRAAPTRTVRIMPVKTRFSSFSRCPQRRSIQSRSRDDQPARALWENLEQLGPISDLVKPASCVGLLISIPTMRFGSRATAEAMEASSVEPISRQRSEA